MISRLNSEHRADFQAMLQRGAQRTVDPRSRGLRQDYSCALREYLGKAASNEKIRLEEQENERLASDPAAKRKAKLPYQANVVKRYYGNWIGTCKKRLYQIRSLVFRAHKAFEKGEFEHARLESTFTARRRCQTSKVTAATKIRYQLYDWFKRQPIHVPIYRSTFYTRMEVLNAINQREAEAKEEPYTPISFGNWHRNRWLNSWCQFYNVSFRKKNKQHKLNRRSWAARISANWRDQIRIRRCLGGPSGDLLYTNWDETQVRCNELENEKFAVETGTCDISAKEISGSSLDTICIISSVHSKPNLRVQGPYVLWKINNHSSKLPEHQANVGKKVKPKLEADLVNANLADKTTFSINRSGHTRHTDLEHIEDWIMKQPTAELAAATSVAKGWRAILSDAAASHTKAYRDNVDKMLEKKVFPYALPGCVTGECQPADLVLFKPAKQALRREQMNYEVDAVLKHGISNAKKPTRLQYHQRFVKAFDEAHQQIDGPQSFKTAGITNAFDGSEDDRMSSVLQAIWRQAGMSQWRQQFLENWDSNHPDGQSPRELYDSLEWVKGYLDWSAGSHQTDEADGWSDGEIDYVLKTIKQEKKLIKLELNENSKSVPEQRQDEWKQLVSICEHVRPGDVSPRAIRSLRSYVYKISSEFKQRSQEAVKPEDKRPPAESLPITLDSSSDDDIIELPDDEEHFILAPISSPPSIVELPSSSADIPSYIAAAPPKMLRIPAKKGDSASKSESLIKTEIIPEEQSECPVCSKQPDAKKHTRIGKCRRAGQLPRRQRERERKRRREEAELPPIPPKKKKKKKTG